MRQRLQDIDWKSEGARIVNAVRRQLRLRGLRGADLADRAQDALALLWQRCTRHPEQSVGMAIYLSAADAARGRTVHSTAPHGYVDVLDCRAMAIVRAEQRESFARRAALAQLDLDLA